MNIEELENERIKIFKKKKRILILFVIFFIIIGFITLYGGFTASSLLPEGSPYKMMFTIGMLIGIIIAALLTYPVFDILTRKEKQKIKSIIGQYALKNISSTIISNVNIMENTPIPPEYVKKIIPDRNELYFPENSFISTGLYKNRQVLLSNIKVYYNYNGNKNNMYGIIDGIWLTCNINKNINTDIEIMANAGNFESISVDMDYSRISINNDIDMLIKIYTKNREEANNVLTPNIINSIEELYKKKKDIIILISNNQIHYIIKNTFKNIRLNIKKPIDINDYSTIIEQELKLLFDFTEIIDNNGEQL